MSPERRIAEGEAVRARLQRMFPRAEISHRIYDYAHASAFAFNLTKGDGRRFGVATSLPLSDPVADARMIGGKFLRQAYPRGWAQP